MSRRAIISTKRVLDVLVAAVGLLLSAPLLVLIAIAIRLDSPGPVLFRQRRTGRLIGKAGRHFVFEEFTILKFRTMKTDAERTTGPALAAERDPRVTRLGMFLRRSRLDELPQFWNVLRGEMSVVGPRPERPELANQFAHAIPFFEERMRDLKPGITGLAQVSLGYTGAARAGTRAEAFQEMMANPLKLEGVESALADQMRMKLLFDLGYSVCLESFRSFIRVELAIMLRSFGVMLRAVGR